MTIKVYINATDYPYGYEDIQDVSDMSDDTELIRLMENKWLGKTIEFKDFNHMFDELSLPGNTEYIFSTRPSWKGDDMYVLEYFN